MNKFVFNFDEIVT